MLHLESYETALRTFERSVEKRIKSAQIDGISTITFSHLPQPIVEDLQKLGYPVEFSSLGKGWIVTVL